MKIDFDYNITARRFELIAKQGEKTSYVYLSPELTQRDTIQELVNWLNKLETS